MCSQASSTTLCTIPSEEWKKSHINIPVYGATPPEHMTNLLKEKKATKAQMPYNPQHYILT